MSYANNVQPIVNDLLRRAAQKLNLQSYKINLNVESDKGNGLLGELYRTSLTDNVTGTTIYLVIKVAPTDKTRRKQTCIETAYKNEIFFYTEIIPAFESLQRGCITWLPQYVESIKECGREMLVLKDATIFGYEMFEKNINLDDVHVRKIFTTYAHFHAMSLSLRVQKPKTFDAFSEALSKAVPSEYMTVPMFVNCLSKILEQALQALDPVSDKTIIAKFTKYVDNTKNSFLELLEYNGKFPTILHGDCWTNNVMFKYSQIRELHSTLLLDFQLVFIGSLVCDLSYFLYSGGDKSLYDKLEEYLDIYHSAFTSMAMDLGCHENDLLPRKLLTDEWKIYARYGMMWAILLTKSKLMSKENLAKVGEGLGKGDGEIDNGTKLFLEAKCDYEEFYKRVREILRHLNEIDAL